MAAVEAVLTYGRAWSRILPILETEFQGELFGEEQLDEVSREHGSTELLVAQVQALKLVLNFGARAVAEGRK